MNAVLRLLVAVSSTTGLGLLALWLAVTSRSKWRLRAKYSEEALDEKQRMENIEPVSERELVDRLRDGGL